MAAEAEGRDERWLRCFVAHSRLYELKIQNSVCILTFNEGVCRFESFGVSGGVDASELHHESRAVGHYLSWQRCATEVVNLLHPPVDKYIGHQHVHTFTPVKRYAGYYSFLNITRIKKNVGQISLTITNTRDKKY